MKTRRRSGLSTLGIPHARDRAEPNRPPKPPKYDPELRITGDSYPGINHPAVKHHACPTCGAKRGEPCIVLREREGILHPRKHTRTHRTRLNRWRVAQDKRRLENA